MRYTISLFCASLAVPAPAFAEVPRVIADIAPVQSLAAMVMGELGTPGLLLGAGADAHDFQLRPGQVAELTQAGLVIWVGPEMTPWLDRTLDTMPEGGARLGLLAAEGTQTRAFGQPEGAGQAEDEHQHAEEDHDHSHGGTDPHAWLDPSNALVWLDAIAAELSRLDPENATVYAVNAQAGADRIAALDADIARRLQPVAGQPFVVFHDAYGYFADHYGLTVAGEIAAGDAASPGASHLKELQAEIASGQVKCIFPEVNHDPKMADLMAEGAGVRVGEALDPEGALQEPGPQLYAALMTDMADRLIACLAEN